MLITIRHWMQKFSFEYLVVISVMGIREYVATFTIQLYNKKKKKPFLLNVLYSEKAKKKTENLTENQLLQQLFCHKK